MNRKSTVQMEKLSIDRKQFQGGKSKLRCKAFDVGKSSHEGVKLW